MSIVLISLSVFMNEIHDKIDEIPANRKCPHHYSMRHQLLHSNNMVMIYLVHIHKINFIFQERKEMLHKLCRYGVS